MPETDINSKQDFDAKSLASWTQLRSETGSPGLRASAGASLGTTEAMFGELRWYKGRAVYWNTTAAFSWNNASQTWMPEYGIQSKQDFDAKPLATSAQISMDTGSPGLLASTGTEYAAPPAPTQAKKYGKLRRHAGHVIYWNATMASAFRWNTASQTWMPETDINSKQDFDAKSLASWTQLRSETGSPGLR